MLNLAVATIQDATEIAAILTQALRYKLEHDDKGWGNEPFTVAEVTDYLRTRIVYIVRSEGKAVGTFTLQWEDADMWGPHAGPAGYIHRLAVSKSAHGRGIGADMLSFAEQEIRKHGLDKARLDCAESNPELCAYYERCGYTRTTTRYIPIPSGTYDAVLFEKRLA